MPNTLQDPQTEEVFIFILNYGDYDFGKIIRLNIYVIFHIF